MVLSTVLREVGVVGLNLTEMLLQSLCLSKANEINTSDKRTEMTSRKSFLPFCSYVLNIWIIFCKDYNAPHPGRLIFFL